MGSILSMLPDGGDPAGALARNDARDSARKPRETAGNPGATALLVTGA
ncbi:hypothetical protein ACFC25_11720 [Pseudarthrobacter sp. NPDC055928]